MKDKCVFAKFKYRPKGYDEYESETIYFPLCNTNLELIDLPEICPSCRKQTQLIEEVKQ